MIKHIRRWNIWRRGCSDSKFKKFLVLIKFIASPTMAFIFLPEEWAGVDKNILQYIKNDKKETKKLYKRMRRMK